MRVIRKVGEEIKEVNYPHIDISHPVAGLEEGIIYYFIENYERPKFNSEKSYLKLLQTLTKEKHEIYSHLLICKREWEIVDHPDEMIIDKLNIAVGNWIEERLPVWKQVKYLTRFMYLDILKSDGVATNEQLSEMIYLNSLDNWVINCRKDRDEMELNFINNQVFPSFIFDEIPIKMF